MTTSGSAATVTHDDLVRGLGRLGLGRDSVVLVHASLRAFGHVEGGADGLVQALVDTCGTVLAMTGTDEWTAVPAPPGLVRPDNAWGTASSWPRFDRAVAAATPYRRDLPVSQWLGATSAAVRRRDDAVVGPHPLYSFSAVGQHADDLIARERAQFMLGSVARAAELGGTVLLLGVGHESNTTIHLAEHRLGRGRLWRYARGADGAWCELPNISGESHRFGEFEASLAPYTVETGIGTARARAVPMHAVLDEVTRAITRDPAVGLCDDDECRCTAALRQLQSGYPGPLQEHP